MNNPNKMLGRFVQPSTTEQFAHGRNVFAAREAIRSTRNAEYGTAITREEGLRRVSAEQAKSLRTHNVMSPDQIAIRAMAGNGAGPIVVEVSAGEFMGDTIFGVTVYHTLPGNISRDWDASNAYHSLEDLLPALRALNGEGE